MGPSTTSSVVELARPSEGLTDPAKVRFSEAGDEHALERQLDTRFPPPPSTQLPTEARKRDQLLKEISCHITLQIAGWSDASAGPLLPFIQAYYGISYTVVSILFVGQMVGFLLAGFNNASISRALGMGRTMTLGAVIQAIGYALLVPAFPFAVMPVAYAIVGFGLALQDAQANVYVATLKDAEHKFGYLHASYGLGGVVVPLAATAFVSHGIRFSWFYALSVGLEVINIAVLLCAFKFNYKLDEHEPAPQDEPIPLTERTTEYPNTQFPFPAQQQSNSTVDLTPPVPAPAPPKRATLREALRSRVVWLFALFILTSVGAGVSLGGWVVTFMISDRGAGSSAGYIATGYWTGCLVGRVALSWINVRVGEKRVMFIYLALCIALEFVVMFAKDLIGDAVAVALVGVLMGPSYPIVMSLASKTIPRRLHASAIGFIAAFGQAGGALFPFATGALSQRFSPAVLQPVVIVLLGVQAVIWVFVPTPVKKEE